ncbi:MAG: cupin domain-containing protein [Atribacterota bacterium]|mgnify:CR=1 FL=1
MIIRKLQDTPIMKTAHNVDARNLYDTENAVISVITLQPGQALKKHITPVDVAFYVLRGKGIVEVGKEKQEVEANTLIESPKDIVHCWYNESDEELSFMVIKVPKPARETKFIS